MQARELAIPSTAANDWSYCEVLRVWIVRHAVACTIRADTWDDAGSWGIALADVAKHAAAAIAGRSGTSETTALSRIHSAFKERNANRTPR
jgi:hypothetical protein